MEGCLKVTTIEVAHDPTESTVELNPTPQSCSIRCLNSIDFGEKKSGDLKIQSLPTPSTA